MVEYRDPDLSSMVNRHLLCATTIPEVFRKVMEPISDRVRPEDLLRPGEGGSSSRGKGFNGAVGGVSERGGGFCVSWRRGQPDKQSPVLAGLHAWIVCPDEQKKKQRQREVDEAGK